MDSDQGAKFLERSPRHGLTADAIFYRRFAPITAIDLTDTESRYAALTTFQRNGRAVRDDVRDDNSVDVAYTFDSFEHFANPACGGATNEAHRRAQEEPRIALRPASDRL